LKFLTRVRHNDRNFKSTALAAGVLIWIDQPG
jgi:hypothetical protein